MHVLVTGGAGYIGSHACKALSQHGFTPVTYDNLCYGHRAAVRWGPFVQGDLHDTARLTQVMQDYKVRRVMHFAAFAYVGESVQKPELYYHNNVGGTLSLLNAMRAAQARELVFSSTCAVYGTPQPGPLTEDHPLQPQSPYGASKMMVERMLQDFAIAHQFGCVSLRYFNAAGADEAGETGESHAPETHLIPLALAAACGRGTPLTIYGQDYPTPDGTCVRDYIHVADLAAAHVLALGKLQPWGAGARAFNLGTGHGFSVREVLATVAEVVGTQVPHTLGPRRPGDPATLVAHCAKAHLDLGWQPKQGGLRQIVETAWRWYRSR